MSESKSPTVRASDNNRPPVVAPDSEASTVPTGGGELGSEHSKIKVGGRGEEAPFVIPAEKFHADEDSKVESLTQDTPDAGRPKDFLWFVLNREAEFQVPLIERSKGFQKTYFWVAEPLRADLSAAIKPYRVFPIWDLAAKQVRIWTVKVHEGSTYYEPIKDVLRQPREFFNAHRLMLIHNQKKHRWDVKTVELTQEEIASVVWPQKHTAEILTEAIGIENCVRMAEHPLYVELTEGTLLTTDEV